MKVLFVGSNPSVKNTDVNIPFEGTKSGTILDKWVRYLELANYQVVNVFDSVTSNNKVLSRKQVKESLHSLKLKLDNIEYDRIVALGKTASEALKLLKISHYKLPHPSPRNRQLNSKDFLDKQLESCKIYVYSKEKA